MMMSCPRPSVARVDVVAEGKEHWRGSVPSVMTAVVTPVGAAEDARCPIGTREVHR